METVLNLVWVLLAVVLVRLWILHGLRDGTSRRTQLAALAMMILILFPVISVTDDLQAAMTPTESESCVRRGHSVTSPHILFPVVAVLPPSVVAELPLGFVGYVPPSNLSDPAVDNPAASAIQNRPPPAA
jgi:hypothetical protein